MEKIKLNRQNNLFQLQQHHGNDKFFNVLNKNTTIKSLKLYNFCINDKHMLDISSKLKNNVLESLSIELYVCSEIMRNEIISGLMENTSLKFLEIKILWELKEMCEFLKIILQKMNLCEIHIKCVFNDGPMMNEFIELLQENKSITSVKNFIQYTNDTVTHLVNENNDGRRRPSIRTKRANP